MALLNCYECDEQISSTASSCPKCGAPSKNNKVANAPVSTTQLTSKKLKLQILISTFIAIAGIVFFLIVSFTTDRGTKLYLPIIITAFGFGWRAFIGFQVWWNHK